MKDANLRKAIYNGNPVVVKQLPVTLTKASDGEIRFMKHMRELLQQHFTFTFLNSSQISRLTDVDLQELKQVIFYNIVL
jgi:hypothetical protein